MCQKLPFVRISTHNLPLQLFPPDRKLFDFQQSFSMAVAATPYQNFHRRFFSKENFSASNKKFCTAVSCASTSNGVILHYGVSNYKYVHPQLGLQNINLRTQQHIRRRILGEHFSLLANENLLLEQQGKYLLTGFLYQGQAERRLRGKLCRVWIC